MNIQHLYMVMVDVGGGFFFGHVDSAVWMHHLDANKTAGEEARGQLHKNVASNIEQVLVATPHKAPTIRPPASYHESYPS